MPNEPREGLAHTLSAAREAYDDRLALVGYKLEALATIALVKYGDGWVAHTTGPAAIPAEHREQIADAAVGLANAIDKRVALLERKVSGAQRIAIELCKLAALGASPALIEAQIDRLAAVLEVDAEAAA